MCLDRLNASVWWQGKGGMVVNQLRGHIRTMLKFEDPPEFLIIHVGCNDIGSKQVGQLRNSLKNTLTFISNDLPKTNIVWSQMLPRMQWRYSKNKKAMEKCRYRVNNSVAKFVLESGGYYIRYPEILRNDKFFEADGVHLSTVANDIFLNMLQGGIEEFLKQPESCIFPMDGFK